MVPRCNSHLGCNRICCRGKPRTTSPPHKPHQAQARQLVLIFVRYSSNCISYCVKYLHNSPPTPTCTAVPAWVCMTAPRHSYPRLDGSVPLQQLHTCLDIWALALLALHTTGISIGFRYRFTSPESLGGLGVSAVATPIGPQPADASRGRKRARAKTRAATLSAGFCATGCLHTARRRNHARRYLRSGRVLIYLYLHDYPGTYTSIAAKQNIGDPYAAASDIQPASGVDTQSNAAVASPPD